ncbi:MAG: hypothetical protein EB127_05295 [Alphaproteobacteria bacterium]|nr:hypothetical protein [Alphaproteobacteria bacterium]
MWEKYKTLIVFVIFMSSIAFLGFRENTKTSWLVKKAVEDAVAKITKPNYRDIAKDPEFKKNIEGLILEYINNNKELKVLINNSIESAINNISQENAVHTLIQDNKDKIYSSSSPFIGAADSKNIIVLFTDYNCGYCKTAAETIKSIMEKTKDIKVIFKPLPLFGANSSYLAQVSAAVFISDATKFADVNYALFHRTFVSNDEVKSMLQEHGLDAAKIEQISTSSEVEDIIKHNIELAKSLKISGVPVFIINDGYYPGLMSYEDIMKILNIKDQKIAEPSPTNDSNSKKEVSGSGVESDTTATQDPKKALSDSEEVSAPPKDITQDMPNQESGASNVDAQVQSTNNTEATEKTQELNPEDNMDKLKNDLKTLKQLSEE